MQKSVEGDSVFTLTMMTGILSLEIKVDFSSI